MPKRKRDRVADPTNKSTQSLPTCIVHVTSITDHGCFTPLSQVRGTASDKLQQICEIRDRRLLQSSDSPYRMQSICDQIPTTLPADLENTGYHHQCYQRFTGNLIHLEDGTTPVSATTPQRRQSTRKSSSPGSKRHIFAPDCIFCEKLETKCGDRKTERADDFPSWRNKENAFGLELETALAKAQDDVSTYLTPQIVTGEGNVVFHCEWDNLNKTTTNVHGNNIVNSAGGIMLQEIKPGFESSHP